MQFVYHYLKKNSDADGSLRLLLVTTIQSKRCVVFFPQLDMKIFRSNFDDRHFVNNFQLNLFYKSGITDK